jgi:undecaprenyl phosphate-alpha-L-ara4N flippase subunit ArnF
MHTSYTLMQNRTSGLASPWFQLGLSVAFVTAYELLLKLGARETAHIAGAGWAWTGLSGLASIYVWLAIPLIVLSLVTWLHVLRHIPLSIAFPISQVVHVFVPLGSWLILGESISKLRWGGIALVLLGLAIVAKPIGRMEERL